MLVLFRNPTEVAHTCRGTINLVSAVIHTVDSSNFVISNGGTQTFHLKASNEIERQRWVTALELAKARAIRMTESGKMSLKYLYTLSCLIYLSLLLQLYLYKKKH